MSPRAVLHRPRSSAGGGRLIQYAHVLPALGVFYENGAIRIEGVIEDGRVISMTSDYVPNWEFDSAGIPVGVTNLDLHNLVSYIKGSRTTSTTKTENEFAAEFQETVAAEFGPMDRHLAGLNLDNLVDATELCIGLEESLDYKVAERRAGDAVLASYRDDIGMKDFKKRLRMTRRPLCLLLGTPTPIEFEERVTHLSEQLNDALTLDDVSGTGLDFVDVELKFIGTTRAPPRPVKSDRRGLCEKFLSKVACPFSVRGGGRRVDEDSDEVILLTRGSRDTAVQVEDWFGIDNDDEEMLP